MLKKFLALAVCAMLALSLFACSSGESPAASSGGGSGSSGSSAPATSGGGDGEPFKIGVIQPLTGANGFGGTECQAALEIAAEEQGTLLGRPIELIFADAPDDATATSEVERLMSTQGVKYFIGAYGFSSIPIQAAVMKNDGFIFETVTWETDLLSGGYENYFMNMVTAEGFANACADNVIALGQDYLGKEPGELKVGMLANSGFPSALYSIVKDRLEELGCTPLVYEIYDENINDFTPIIMKLKSAECDVVIPSQFAPDADKYRKACMTLDYHPAITFGTGVAYDEPAFAQIGEGAEGCMTMSYTNPAMDLDSAKGLREFDEKFLEKTGHSPITHALMAYSGAKVFFEGIENAGADDYESVREALYALDIPVGDTPAYWGVKFDPATGHNTLAGEPLVIGQWFDDGEGGYEYKVVYPENLATAEMEINAG